MCPVPAEAANREDDTQRLRSIALGLSHTKHRRRRASRRFLLLCDYFQLKYSTNEINENSKLQEGVLISLKICTSNSLSEGFTYESMGHGNKTYGGFTVEIRKQGRF